MGTIPNPAIDSLDHLPDFLTVTEAAAILRIGRNTAYSLCQRWLRTGGQSGLPVVKLGRSLRVPLAGLRQLPIKDA